MIRYRLILLCFLFFLYQEVAAQEILTSRGKAQMILEDDISKEDLKENLRLQAKIDAIERQFGSLIEQESRVEINEGGTTFNIVGERYLKGEWLKTTKEKFSEEYRKVHKWGKDQMELWISCEIEGLIRERSRPEISFDFTITNCPDKLCRTTDFYNGESMFLFFKSPVDGYLSVFSIEEKEAFRLLPYQQMPSHLEQQLRVIADKEYFFFSADEKQGNYEAFAPGYADELVMTTDHKEEYTYLYVIFSVSEIVKPTLLHSYADIEKDYIVPSSLSMEEFESWISENRILNQDFYFKKVRLKISNK